MKAQSPDDDCENKVIHPKYYKYLANILAHEMALGVIVQPKPGFGTVKIDNYETNNNLATIY